MPRRLKSLLPRTLFGRTLLIIVMPLIVAQVVAGIVFFDLGWDTAARRAATVLAGETALVVQLLDRYPDPRDQAWLLQTVGALVDVRLTLDPTARLAPGGPPAASAFVEYRLVSALNRVVALPFALDLWSHPTDLFLRIQTRHGLLELVASRGRLVTSPVVTYLQWAIGSTLIVGLIAALYMRNQVRPIQRLAAAAEAFGKGHDAAEYSPSGAREVRQAGAAFVVMRERIRRFLQQRTEMLAGVSHDLRTPLTRMKLGLAMLGDDKLVAGLKSDVAEMERMVGSYLAFVRGEGGESTARFDLRAMLDDIAGSARRAGQPLDLSTEGELALLGRPQAIKRAIENLIANAQRHGRRIALAAARRGQRIEITIDDDGPGIPADRREDVFKPFYRLDSARGAGTGGVGLGLTLARDTARSHGGDVTLADSPLGGLRARMVLPV